MIRPLIVLSLLVGLSACGREGQKAPAEKGATTPAANAVHAPGPDGIPMLRAGLWESSQRRGDGVETERACLAGGLEPDARAFLLGPAEPGCEKSRSMDPDGLRVSMRCRRSGMETEISMSLAGAETRYEMEMGVHVTGADGVRRGETTSTTGRWVAPCPAGVEPGDAID